VGGMEYPTLITTLSFCFFPKGLKIPETLIVHEFIHQYFMQMVATNEAEEPWMDEGITTYYESRILDSFLNPESSAAELWGVNVGSKEYNRAEYMSSAHPKIASNAIKSWEYNHGGYGEIAYNKAAIWLQTMEGLLGIELMDDIMKTYFQTWQFKHPGRQDFINIVNEKVIEQRPESFPDGMDWFFEQVLYGTEECDYAVASISNEKRPSVRGYFEDYRNCEWHSSSDDKYISKVLLYRLGEVKVPQEIMVMFEDGSSEMHQWNGLERAYELIVPGYKKITSVQLDPHRKIYLDNNFVNNSYSLKTEDKGVKRLSAIILTGLQHIAESLTMFL